MPGLCTTSASCWHLRGHMAASADEAGFYDALVASQRVGDWLHAIQHGVAPRRDGFRPWRPHIALPAPRAT